MHVLTWTGPGTAVHAFSPQEAHWGPGVFSPPCPRALAPVVSSALDALPQASPRLAPSCHRGLGLTVASSEKPSLTTQPESTHHHPMALYDTVFSAVSTIRHHLASSLPALLLRWLTASGSLPGVATLTKISWKTTA